MKRNLKPVVFALLLFLLALLVIFLLPWGVIGKTLFSLILSAFQSAYLSKIAYISTFIVVAGLLVLLLKRLPPVSDAFIKFRDTFKGAIPVSFKTSKSLRTWSLFIVPLLVIFLFYAPYIFKGQDTTVKIFDVLDAWVPQTKILAESGKAFSFNPGAKVDNLINGLGLNGFPSGYNVSTWLFMIFKPFTAYTINLLLMAFTGFWGMALLMKKYIVKVKEYNWLIMGTALCFALLTFYPPGGISIAGFPLLLYCFLEIRNREEKVRHFVFVFFFPFYSLLHHAGIFIIIVLGVIFLMDIFKEKRFNTPFFLALVLLGATYIFTHFHLIYSLLDSGFASFREEITAVPRTLKRAFFDSIHNFIFDRTNVVSGQHFVIMLSTAWALGIGFFNKNKEKGNINRLMLFLLLALLSSFLWGFKFWEGLMPLRESMQFLTAFNFARFYWLNPALWHIIFGVSLLIISTLKYGKRIVSLLIIAQVLFLFSTYNLEYRRAAGLRNRVHSTLTFRQFYSEDLFKQIEQYIGKPKKDYRTINIGLHPGINQYNGFYTLDIYSTVYPLEHKHRFREIFEKELEKSESVRRAFDDNAKRCYLLSSELHGKKKRGLTFARGITKTDAGKMKIKNLELNTAALREMGGQYIFSAVEILNYKENNLSFEKTFENKKSPWKIYLYKVNDENIDTN